ncbi:hypothetical protein H8S45_08440 [Agathobaculum sp. NSJ-28]|uniref:Uncharacterized protein n=2 Tax=Agathobaculum TaxID=2048137 RepID=A0A923LUE1_9FIRM|nr:MULTISPECIES: hypothetical protein [Agathobaculum]MBC5725483.1 hypothetical protein [Agathobaculum faecis]MCU6789236.1 hypothetical protein [Agathobaculum ammoniilyticum]SCJ12242.1 Uncharacterised protein [uncultured Butyricicoccus sp.]
MKTKSAAVIATEHRWNTYQSRKHLAAKIAASFSPDSRLYTLPLDLHRFNLSADLLHWHWKQAFIRPLRGQLAMHAQPLPLRYIYAFDMRTPDATKVYLLTDAPDEEVQVAFSCFWLHGDNPHAERLADIGAQYIAELMTVQAHGIEGKRAKKMYTSSRALCAAG